VSITLEELDMLLEGIAPVVREEIVEELKSRDRRITALERRLDALDGRSADESSNEVIERAVRHALEQGGL
jgi:hypothetical protein